MRALPRGFTTRVVGVLLVALLAARTFPPSPSSTGTGNPLRAGGAGP